MTPELWHPVDNAGTPVPRKAGTGAERRKNGQSGGGNLTWNPQEDENEATLFQHAGFEFAACLSTLCRPQCRQAPMTPRPASHCQKRVWEAPLACLREATETKVTLAVQKYLSQNCKPGMKALKGVERLCFI